MDCEDGGDTRAKGAAVTFSMLLYRSLDLGNKEIVKEVIICGDIIMKAPTNTEAEPQ